MCFQSINHHFSATLSWSSCGREGQELRWWQFHIMHMSNDLKNKQGHVKLQQVAGSMKCQLTHALAGVCTNSKFSHLFLMLSKGQDSCNKLRSVSPLPPGYAGQRDPQVLNLPAPNFHLGRERHFSPFHPRLPCSTPATQATVHVRVEMGVSIGIYRFMNSLPSGGFCMGGFRQYMWYPLSQPSQNSNWSYNRRNCHDQGITSQWFYL